MFVSPTSSIKRSPTASTAFNATHISRCSLYSSWPSSAKASTQAAARAVTARPVHAARDVVWRVPRCAAAMAVLALRMAHDPLWTDQQKDDHQREHRDWRVRQVVERAGDALDRGDQEAGDDGAGYAAKPADDD